MKSQRLKKSNSVPKRFTVKDLTQNSNIFHTYWTTKNNRGNKNFHTLSPGSIDKVTEWWDEHQKPYKSVTEFYAAIAVVASHWCTAGNCKRFYSWLVSHKWTTNMQIQVCMHARASIVLEHCYEFILFVPRDIWNNSEKEKKENLKWISELNLHECSGSYKAILVDVYSVLNFTVFHSKCKNGTWMYVLLRRVSFY